MLLDVPANHELILSNAYFGAFALTCAWELIISRRALSAPMRVRWPVNFTLGVINVLLGRWLFPVIGVTLAVSFSRQGIGLFNSLQVPATLAVVGSLLALDLVYYAWHWLNHRVPFLWRFHQVHHGDVDVDLTTDLRHHPIEAILSAALLLSAIAGLGAPPLAVFLFLLLQSVDSLWQHGNVRIPAGADRIIRWVFVTPDMHRIHHSADRVETDSNYTMLFSFWDRLFGTYRPAPRLGHEGMTLGLSYLRGGADQRIHRVLLYPFRRLANRPA